MTDLLTEVNRLRTEVRQIKTTQLRADVVTLQASEADAIHDNVSAEISGVTEKTSPVDADLILIEDSAASDAKKRVQLGNLAGGDVIFADTIDDIDLTAGQVEIATVTETLAVGDIVIVEGVFLVYNDGSNQNFEIIPDYDDVYGGASITHTVDANAAANKRNGIFFRDQMQIHSSSSSTRLMEVRRMSADADPAVEVSQSGNEMEWDEDAGDLTGSTIITVDVDIQTGAANETVAGSITIRKISSA